MSNCVKRDIGLADPFGQPLGISDVRYMGGLPGRYILASRGAAAGQLAQVFACRARSISSRVAVLQAPVSGRAGEDVVFRFDDLGILRGTVARRTAHGFVADLVIGEKEQLALLARLAWLKKRGQQPTADRRRNKRWLPRVPRSELQLDDGRKAECFIIDVSATGLAISADVGDLKAGSSLTVGTLAAKVVRRLEVGFAVEFNTVQDPALLEPLLLATTR
jgi:hypothetical protein